MNGSSAPTLGLAGRYVIRRELGRGMMGVVYQAEDTLLGRTVALKTIELAFEAGEETYQHFEERFFTEARVAAKLSHPGIVVCHDVGKDPASGKLFIVFEYLRGLTLAERIVADTIAWEDALAMVIKVARAIHHAHVNGVIHRDLKPANVMLLDSGHAGLEANDATAIKIMDFGVARLESLPGRLTGTGQSFGSPLYMSPEQVLGRPATARSDIFSLGSVLCTLLLGRGWFEARNIPEVLARVVHDEAPAVSRLRPQLPGTLDDVVARALAKRPEDRYATAAEMAEDLEDVLAGLAPRHVSARPPVTQVPATDALLGDLAKNVARAGASMDPAEALASLVDDTPPAEATLPAPLLPAESRMPAAAAAGNPQPPARPAALSRWTPRVAALVIVAALLAAGAFLARGRQPSESLVVSAPGGTGETRSPPPPAADPAPTAPAVGEPADSANAPAVPASPSESSGTPRPTITVRPRVASAPPALAPEQPAAAVSLVALPSPARMRLVVQHPFESGRLVLWIDGALVYETKLRASESKTIVAIKVREGRLEKVLDVAPGRHEVRVEVSWEDQHRVGSRLIDVADGATGLLELRVGRLTKDLNLEWSRLAD